MLQCGRKPVKVTELLLVVCHYLLSRCRKCGWQTQLGHPAQDCSVLSLQGSLVSVTSGAWLAARGPNWTFCFWDLRSKPPTTAGQQWSCHATPLLAAEGPRQTTNCLHLAGEQEEINQFKRQFSLINRISFYSCRLVTSKHYGNSLPEEQQKFSLHVFFSHSKLPGLAQPLRGLWHATCLTKASDAALHCPGVVKGTICLCFVVFFPVSHPQASEKHCANLACQQEQVVAQLPLKSAKSHIAKDVWRE